MTVVADCEFSVSVGWDGIRVVGMMLGGHIVDPITLSRVAGLKKYQIRT